VQLEKHFGNSRDIEFAVGEDDTVYLLQVIGHSRLTHSYLFCGDDRQPVNLVEFHSQ